MAWVDRRLSAVPPPILERSAIVLVLLLGAVDYLLGPDRLFGVFYLIPIGLSAWYGTSKAEHFTCGLAAATWLGADLLARSEPFSIGLDSWNAGVRFAGFLVVAVLVRRLKEALEEQRELALLDPLTGLENTRAFFSRLAHEIDRSVRYGRVFTIAYLDLDHFKEVNDTLGHAEGDEVLKRVARTLRETMRGTDVTARLGGDEFGIILPETPYAQAEDALEKLRREVLEVMRKEDWPVTVSVGAVTFEASVETAKEAVQMADRLMYEVKDGGRDGIRHILWTGVSEDPA